MSACLACKADESLGAPSQARWVGPDGEAYCSMHFLGKFGHGEKLVLLADYAPPKASKPPAPKKPRAKKAVKK